MDVEALRAWVGRPRFSGSLKRRGGFEQTGKYHSICFNVAIGNALPCAALATDSPSESSEQCMAIELRLRKDLLNGSFKGFAKLATEVIDDFFGFYSGHT